MRKGLLYRDFIWASKIDGLHDPPCQKDVCFKFCKTQLDLLIKIDSTEVIELDLGGQKEKEKV